MGISWELVVRALLWQDRANMFSRIILILGALAATCTHADDVETLAAPAACTDATGWSKQCTSLPKEHVCSKANEHLRMNCKATCGACGEDFSHLKKPREKFSKTQAKDKSKAKAKAKAKADANAQKVKVHEAAAKKTCRESERA